MKTSVRVPVGAGLAALVLAAGAVGCSKEDGGSDSPKMTPAAAVAKAAKKTGEINSLSYRMTGKMPEEGRIEAQAEMQLKPSIAMSMKMTALDKGAEGKAEIRLLDKAMYIGGGPEAAKEMDGKSWLKFDLAAMGAGDELNQLGGASQADKNPATESTFLTGAKDVEKVGTETVEGTETTHYKGTVTLADLEKGLGGESKDAQDARKKSIEQYKKMGVEKLVMDTWIDKDDQTKQFRMRSDADKGPMDMTITFLSFNEPVKITAPPAAETADLAELMGQAQQG